MPRPAMLICRAALLAAVNATLGAGFANASGRSD
jgi:hypothetical protein